jgi:hypothetical protein
MSIVQSVGVAHADAPTSPDTALRTFEQALTRLLAADKHTLRAIVLAWEAEQMRSVSERIPADCVVL